MTRNESIIEAFRHFYLSGSSDTYAKEINFEKRFKEFWESFGNTLFPDLIVKFEPEDSEK